MCAGVHVCSVHGACVNVCMCECQHCVCVHVYMVHVCMCECQHCVVCACVHVCMCVWKREREGEEGEEKGKTAEQG